MSRKHRLTEKDLAALKATCSACGPSTPIAKNGRGWVCREGRREAVRRWTKNHPAKAREIRNRPPSKHRLEKRDGSPDKCAVCGPVEPVVMGRGYGCPNRAKELGWKVFALEPQPACPVCRTYLDRFGSCAKCDNEADVDDIWIPRESRRAPDAGLVGELIANGFSFVEHDSFLPAGDESAVPGWKTLGSLEPWSGVKPAYAALYGAGRKTQVAG